MCTTPEGPRVDYRPIIQALDETIAALKADLDTASELGNPADRECETCHHMDLAGFGPYCPCKHLAGICQCWHEPCDTCKDRATKLLQTTR